MRLLFLIICLNFACTSKENNDSNKAVNFKNVDSTNIGLKRKNFDSLIIEIDRNIGDSLDYSEELLTNNQFLEIYKHSSLYFNDAISFLEREKLSGWRPYLCILSMQNLSVRQYVKLCDVYLSLYKRNKVSEGVMQEAITPNFLKSRIIPSNYKDDNVQVLLNSILDQKISSEFRSIITDIKSGKYISDIKQIE